MSLLKRRSRSETRKLEQNLNGASLQNTHEINLQRKLKESNNGSNAQKNRTYLSTLDMTIGSMGRRKTSAEMISEAKTFLGDVTTVPSLTNGNGVGGGGVAGLRLISTRRPITPRESGRALYGKVSLAGRPPSSFSLRYLQNEGNRTPMTPMLTPPLEPIKKPRTFNSMNTNEFEHLQRTRSRRSRRSLSVDGKFEYIENEINNSTKIVPRKLPALEIKGTSLSDGRHAVEANTNDSKGEHIQNAKVNLSKSLDSQDAISKTINLLASRNLLSRSNDLLAQSTTEKLIDMLKEHAGLKDCTDETVNHVNSILSELYERVRKNDKNYKRGFILGGLYGLVECFSPKILLAVARVVLALHVTGSNLTGACKLIFKVARSEQNDSLFHDNDILELLIDGLGRASPLDDPEACIYGYGSIRFLTSSSAQERAEASAIKDVNKNWSECLELPRKPSTAPAASDSIKLATCEIMQRERLQKLCKQYSLVERLARHGAVELMVLHLQILNESGATRKLTGPPLHSLYQLSAALRALADVRQTSCSIEHRDIIEVEQRRSHEVNIQLELACPHLIRAAEVSIGELEVQANIVRTLSVLSEDNDCCKVLANFAARIGILLGPCCELFNSSSEKLLSLFSRLGYILGNIMAKHDNARIQFYHNDVAMEYLIKVLELYSKEPLTVHNSAGDSVIDVLIKMIRVIANMSVNAEVGFGLGNTRALGVILLNLLNATNQIRAVKIKTELQELIHATLGALHNLCFYQDKNNTTPAQVIESKGSLQSILSDLATALCVTLRTCSDSSTQVETTRVLGNLTRNEKARRLFCLAGGLTLVVQYLTHNTNVEYDFKACAIGVLVNLLGDYENRRPFIQFKGSEVLLDLLRSALEQEDWFLATIVCQAFWNVLIDAKKLIDICQEQVLDDVCDLLADYLDDERIFEDCNCTNTLWEEFAVVATDLLERIQCNLERQQDEDGEEEVPEPRTARVMNEMDDDNDEDDVYIDEM